MNPPGEPVDVAAEAVGADGLQDDELAELLADATAEKPPSRLRRFASWVRRPLWKTEAEREAEFEARLALDPAAAICAEIARLQRRNPESAQSLLVQAVATAGPALSVGRRSDARTSSPGQAFGPDRQRELVATLITIMDENLAIRASARNGQAGYIPQMLRPGR